MAVSRSKVDSSNITALSFEGLSCFIDFDRGLQRALEDEGYLNQLQGPWEDFRAALEQRLAHWKSNSYRYYREILALSLQETLRNAGVKVDDRIALQVADSLREWDIYPGVVSALRRLGSQWPLLIITDIDRAPLGRLVDRLGVPFAELVPGESVRAYKPAPEQFKEARRRLGDREAGLLHLSAVLETDLRPAAELGIHVAWLNTTKSKAPDDLDLVFEASDLLEVCTRLGC